MAPVQLKKNQRSDHLDDRQSYINKKRYKKTNLTEYVLVLYGGSSRSLLGHFKLQSYVAFLGQFHGLISFVPKFAGSFISCKIEKKYLYLKLVTLQS
jgi:hypothetical protein